MKTFENYVRYREAAVADQNSADSSEAIDILIDLMREVWLEDPNVVLQMLKKLEELSPGKYNQRINDLRKRKSSPFGTGLDKPDDDMDKPHHDIVKPEADRVGDQSEKEEG